MTKPEPKKRGPKPKPKVEAAPAVEAAEPVVVEAVEAPAPIEPVEAPEDHDEPACDEIALPLIDGTDPAWAVSATIGARHVQFVAHSDITPADVVKMLAAKTITLPGHNAPTLIAARAVTPPKIRPVRVTFTVRERIEA